MFLTIDGDHGGEPTGSMRPIFVARGPAFKKNYTTLKSTTVNSVDIYNLMCFILDLVPGPNNGSFENVQELLEPNYYRIKILEYIKEIVNPNYLKNNSIIESDAKVVNFYRKKFDLKAINNELKDLLRIINSRIRFFILIIVLFSFILIFQLKMSRWPNELEWVVLPTVLTGNYAILKE